MGEEDQGVGVRLSLYLLDTTVLIDHLRSHDGGAALLGLVGSGHVLGTSCVNVAELERGVQPKERKALERLLERLRYLETTREAAERAGRYQADFARRGGTLHTSDALIAGTARAHGAVLLTGNAKDFPMRDVTVRALPR